jgi:membrane dipeptidase
MQWFDAHLDLAYLAECGRDMLAPLDPQAGPHPPAAVTLPSLRDGGISACLGTIFTEAYLPGRPAEYLQVAYPIGDADAAHTAGLRQLDRYQRWAQAGEIEQVLSGAQRRLGAPHRQEGCALADPHPMTLGILVECADPIRSPDQLPWWAERGVVAIGLAWVHGSRYAGGNGPSSCETGITPAGRDFIRAMDSLGLVHDASHLSQRALDELLCLTDRRVIASHSNCRTLIDGQNQRHLSDDAIREIGRRGGVIGLNLYSPFLRSGLSFDAPGRASIDDALRHIEHIADLHGHDHGLGLGSDMDGGFSAARLPEGIDVPRDLSRLAAALSARGWTDERVHAFAWGNWARFFGL